MDEFYTNQWCWARGRGYTVGDEDHSGPPTFLHGLCTKHLQVVLVEHRSSCMGYSVTLYRKVKQLREWVGWTASGETRRPLEVPQLPMRTSLRQPPLSAVGLCSIRAHLYLFLQDIHVLSCTIPALIKDPSLNYHH